ncbi:energy-coupling factor transport system permease protein [Bacillus chungangensis]|uniref:Energy-coupling factor transporter transmembrane protein EcfT n=2 Tax=Bacillus chungangensis TaxID=587633 RepID=A0ABT9WVJ6_9BACI|nr:energy-coupling factor transport system permease protein [Bacillus chungangensis]
MEKMIFGRYVPTNSIIHRLDPRAKLLIVFIYICIVFLANNVLSYVALAMFTILLIVLSKIPLLFFINGLKPILWLVIFTFILHLFFTKGGDVIFEFGIIKVYAAGLKQGIFISIRFMLLVFMASLLTLTTTPISLTDGLESLLHPLKKLKLPIHELALMMSISLRFIPTLMDETDKIMKAQKARGVDFSSGPLKERLKAIVALLIPLFISSFKRAEDLATAMEARGYRGGEGRTKYRLLQWKLVDSLGILLIFILTGILIYLRT